MPNAPIPRSASALAACGIGALVLLVAGQAIPSPRADRCGASAGLQSVGECTPRPDIGPAPGLRLAQALTGDRALKPTTDALKRELARNDAALRRRPRDASTWVRRGITFTKLGAYRRGIRDFNQAIELDPRMVDAFILRGDAYFKVGGVGGAILNYKEAIKLDPRNVEAYLRRGIARAADAPGRNPDLAMADFDRAAGLAPRDPRPSHQRGKLLLELDRVDEAIERFNDAIDLDPTFGEPYFDRALAQARVGDHRRALAGFNSAERLSGASIALSEGRARSLVALGLESEAISALDEARKIGGDILVLDWQNRLAENRLYLGPFDGVYTQTVEDALLECLASPECS